MRKSELIFKNSLVNYKLSKENQRLFLNNDEVMGAQTAQLSINNPRNPVSFLGMSNVNTIINGQPIATVAIQSLLVNSDNLINFTGSNGADGYIVSSQNIFKNRVHIVFRSSYMTNYSLRYSDGQVPTIDSSFSCFDSAGVIRAEDFTTYKTNTGILNSTPNYNWAIPSRGSISLSLAEFTTNRLTSFELNLSMTRNPQYAMGRITPFRVELVTPITVLGNFQFEVGNYQLDNLQTLIENRKAQDVTLTVNDYLNTTNIGTYSFSQLELVGQTYSTAINGNVVASVQYKGYINV